MQDAAKTTVFNSQEICIYHEEKLVACSFFDLGKKSLTSIVGIYHPDYQKDSLGFYTMLLEIEYGVQQGYDYYYPGYLVPYYPKFDYKTRIGKPEEVEFFDLRTDTWKPLAIYDFKKTLTIETGEKLENLSNFLTKYGISTTLLFYPCHEPYLVKQHSIQMKSPLFLSCFSDYFIQPQFLILYDYYEEVYRFYDCTPPDAASVVSNDESPAQNAGEMLNFMRHQRLIFKTADVMEIMGSLKRLQLKLLAQAFSAAETTEIDKEKKQQ